MVKLALLQQDTEVLEDGRKPTRWCRRRLERFNDGVRAQNTLKEESDKI